MLKSIGMGVCLSVASIGITAEIAYAKTAEIYTSWRNNLAIAGYDTVSFHMGSPQKGKAKITMNWNGAKWQFSTQANLDAFRESPEKYAPAYGGYCAWALAEGKLAKGSPKYWMVIEGRLYLNFNQNIQTRWERSADMFIVKADKNWPRIRD